MRLIDADALLRGIPADAYSAQTDYAEGLRDMIDDINRAKTIDAAPVVHGRWIDGIDTDTKMAECSECGARNVVGRYVYKPYPWKYCCNCGAKMDERSDNAEHCVACGETIPEGRQICPECEEEAAKGV